MQSSSRRSCCDHRAVSPLRPAERPRPERPDSDPLSHYCQRGPSPQEVRLVRRIERDFRPYRLEGWSPRLKRGKRRIGVRP